MEFSKDIQEILKTKFNNIDIYSLNKQELELLKTQVEDLRHEYSLLELAQKTLGNAAYGACASPACYFFNVHLAEDITGECRNLTKTMWKNLEEWFHEGIWKRKDLWEQFDFELDESKHDWYREQHVSIYSDTDSVYISFGAFFKVMTPKYQMKYESDEAKLQWILKYNKDFQDKLNNKWCEDIYGPRFGHNIHEFELETVSKAGIYLAKKKYLKGLVFNKGNFYEKPKVSGTGIEIIKSTTPTLCRDILKELMNDLMFNYKEDFKKEYILEFQSKLAQYRKEFYSADIEDISQSVGIGNYKKYVKNDKDQLVLEMRCPPGIQATARYNYLAHQNGEDNLYMVSGKIKYYNIKLGKNNNGFFGFPSGELPSWAPPMDKLTQWQKTIIEPINRFLEIMDIPIVNAGDANQLTLF